MPPSRFNKVVLPDPDGPMTAEKSPSGILRCRSSKIRTLSRPFVWIFRTPFKWNKSVMLKTFLGAICEFHFCAHVGQDACVRDIETDTYSNRCLVPVGSRDDCDNMGAERDIRIGVQYGFDSLAHMHPADEGFVHVGVNLQAFHIHDRANARAREASAS